MARTLCFAVVTCVMGATLSMAVVNAAAAEETKIPDEVVERLMKSQWDDMPTEITNIPGDKPNEYVSATVDRDKHIVSVSGSEPREVKILPDDVREVIRATYRAKNASICGLKDASKRNWLHLMARFSAKDYYFFDIYFLNRLFNRYLTKLEADYKKDHPNDTPCTEDQKKQVVAQIEDYIKANPLPEKTAAANK